jgi:hypothetical protein
MGAGVSFQFSEFSFQFSVFSFQCLVFGTVRFLQGRSRPFFARRAYRPGIDAGSGRRVTIPGDSLSYFLYLFLTSAGAFTPLVRPQGVSARH